MTFNVTLTTGDMRRLMLVDDWEEAWAAAGRVVYLRARATRRVLEMQEALRALDPIIRHFPPPQPSAPGDRCTNPRHGRVCGAKP